MLTSSLFCSASRTLASFSQVSVEDLRTVEDFRLHRAPDRSARLCEFYHILEVQRSRCVHMLAGLLLRSVRRKDSGCQSSTESVRPPFPIFSKFQSGPHQGLLMPGHIFYVFEFCMRDTTLCVGVCLCE